MRTDGNLAALKDALVNNCGDFFEACIAVGLSVQFVAQWRKDDAEVNAVLTEASQLGSLRLESAAIRRAVHGVMDPVFYQGEVVGHKAVYSDGLLQTLMKGKLPGTYAPDSEGGARMVFNGPTQINNMPRAGNYEEWLEMKAVTLAQRGAPGDAALPAPLAVLEPPIDAAFTRVDPTIARLGLHKLSGLGL